MIPVLNQILSGPIINLVVDSVSVCVCVWYCYPPLLLLVQTENSTLDVGLLPAPAWAYTWHSEGAIIMILLHVSALLHPNLLHSALLDGFIILQLYLFTAVAITIHSSSSWSSSCVSLVNSSRVARKGLSPRNSGSMIKIDFKLYRDKIISKSWYKK